MTEEEINREEDLKKGLQELADRRLASEKISQLKKEEVKTPLSELEESIEKLKEANDAVERELLRKEELKAKLLISGRAQAGQYIPEKTPEEKAQEEAAAILKKFR